MKLSLSPNAEGALWMLASCVCFTIMASLIKYLGDSYAAPLQTLYRQAAALVVLAPLLISRGPSIFKTSRPGMLLFRAGAGTLAIMLAAYAYQRLPLAEANALSFTRALWLALIAAFLLHERLSAARIMATLLGFAGVLIIVAPAFSELPALAPTLASLASALLFAFTIAGGKVMTQDHSVLTIIAWNGALGFVFALPGALFFWAWPTPWDSVLLAFMGAAAVATQACFVKALQRGDAAAIAPIDYTRLVFAILFGFVFFGEAPTALTLLGAAIIVTAALYEAWREQSAGRPAQEE